MVTDRPEKIREVDIIIAELDRPPVQIMIESKLVELAPNSSDKMGIDWDKTLSAQLGNQTEIGGNILQYSLLNTGTDKLGDWKMGYLSAGQYGAVLDFLKSKTNSKLVSNPRILALDNEESSISVGTTVPVPQIQRGTSGTGDMVTFEYKEVNIQLNVTPHAGEGNKITMYVNPVIEEITSWVEYGESRAPVTDKRAVNSIVTINNGETVVIGGLIKTQKTETVKGKPKSPLAIRPRPIPNTTPIIPPTPESVIASVRNCRIILARLAPIALRTPISRVRSVTETSMIFITPIPPTSRDMPAIAPSSRVMLSVEELMVLMRSSIDVRLKSSSSPQAIL